MNAPSPARAWLLASRPATLGAALVPVAVGSACAASVGHFRWPEALAALLGALFIQVGTNFANDVFDHEKGADTAERLGPTRAVQAGLLSARAMKRGMWLAFGLAALAGLFLVVSAGPAVIVIGVCSVISGIAYTGGPYPLGYHGLGDLFVLVFFGFVAVCGTVFVQAGFVPAVAWYAAVPVGCLCAAILVVNNLRDVDTDRRAGKRTLAVRLGPTSARVEYGLLMAVAYGIPALLVATGQVQRWALLPMLTAPLAVVLISRVAREEGRALNRRLGQTARTLMLFGMLFAAGLAPVRP